MLTEQEINEILDSKEQLTEYVTASMVEAISAGLRRVRDPTIAPSAIAQFVDALRKTRADLTGDSAQANAPTMTVSIQFQQRDGVAPPAVIEGTVTRPNPSDSPLVGEPPNALSNVSNMDE